jgi:tetratricopeptide (TPR) repeat protein
VRQAACRFRWRAMVAKLRECFLVMPIRKAGTEEHEYFRALRDTVLEPVMKQLGYHVTRADDITKSGSITSDVIKRLATADLVVADLTDLNPNVFYELGVRHTLRGNGTIMIVDTDHTTVPFDLSPYRVIEFTPDLRGIEKLRDMLIQFGNAISGAKTDSIKDNPVHDFLSSLPDDIYAHVEGSLEGDLRQEIAQLREQLGYYAERFGAGSPELSRQEAAIDTVSTALIQAQRGELPVDLFYKARLLAREENRVQFLTTLRQLMEARVSAISADSWNFLASDAIRLGLENVALVLHEQAVELRPRDQSLKRQHLSTLAHSVDPALRIRARSELASLLGIEISEDSVSFPALPADRLSTVGVMLDAYHHDHLDAEALRITTVFVEKYPNKTVALRNHARALNLNGYESESFECYRRAVNAPDADDTSANWYGGRLATSGRIAEAIEAYLTACRLDSDNARHYVSAASQLAYGVRERITGLIRHPPGLPAEIPASIVDDFVKATLSCPTITTETIELARSSLERVESDPSLLDSLLELRRHAGAADGESRLYTRAERIRLVHSLMERLPKAVLPSEEVGSPGGSQP